MQMRIRGEVSVGKQSVAVDIENSGRLLRITGPFSKRPLSFEAQARVSCRDRLVNWFRLSCASRLPVRCTFTAVRLTPSKDGLTLEVDPGWPWDEPLSIRIADDDRGILAEWNGAATGAQVPHVL